MPHGIINKYGSVLHENFDKCYTHSFNLSNSKLQTIHLNNDITVTFENLIDYLTCICKIKYSVQYVKTLYDFYY